MWHQCSTVGDIAYTELVFRCLLAMCVCVHTLITDVWSMNQPLHFLVHSELLFAVHILTSWDLTTDQHYPAIARHQTGSSQTVVVTESSVTQCHQQVAKELKESQRSIEVNVLATSPTDDSFIVNTALRNSMMNVTQLKGTKISSRFKFSVHNVGDIKKSAMHQPPLLPDKPLVVLVLQCGQVCLVNTYGPTLSEWYSDKPILYYLNNLWTLLDVAVKL